ncbi:hypothetical protein VCHENC02_1196B, partial [Vibrio harveyi]
FIDEQLSCNRIDRGDGSSRTVVGFSI